jgi:hypothetical protein
VIVELVQLRSDLSVGRLQLHVENASPEPLELLSARLAAPGFEEDAVWQRAPATVPSGGALNLPLPIPPVDCDADSGPLTVAGTAEREGATVAFEVEPADPLGTLARILATACAAERTADAVRIEATEVAVEGTGDTSVAVVTLDLRPTGGGGGVHLVEVRPTVLLRAEEGDDGWPLDVVVDSNSAPQQLALRMEPARCDAHALADDKVGTLFPVVVELQGGGKARFPLPLAAGVKDALLRFVAAHCGLNG